MCGGVGLVVKALVHVRGPLGRVAEGSQPAQNHRPVLGGFTPILVQPGGGHTGNTPQGVQPVQRGLEGGIGELARRIGGGAAGLEIKDLAGKGGGICRQQVDDLLLAQPGHVRRAGGAGSV